MFIHTERPPSSGVGPLPAVDGVDVVRADGHFLAGADGPVAQCLAATAEAPAAGRVLCPFLCDEEVAGGPQEVQQSLVTPDGRVRGGGGGGPIPRGHGGESAVTTFSGQKQEEVRVALEQLQGQGGLWLAANRVILATHAQHGDGHLVHVA